MCVTHLIIALGWQQSLFECCCHHPNTQGLCEDQHITSLQVKGSTSRGKEEGAAGGVCVDTMMKTCAMWGQKKSQLRNGRGGSQQCYAISLFCPCLSHNKPRPRTFAALLRLMSCGPTTPVTTRPKMGSGLSIEWPPARGMPASLQMSTPPFRISCGAFCEGVDECRGWQVAGSKLASGWCKWCQHTYVLLFARCGARKIRQGNWTAHRATHTTTRLTSSPPSATAPNPESCTTTANTTHTNLPV